MFILTVDTNEILSGGSDSDGHVDIVCFVFLGFCDRVKNFLISTQEVFPVERSPFIYILSHWSGPHRNEMPNGLQMTDERYRKVTSLNGLQMKVTS